MGDWIAKGSPIENENEVIGIERFLAMSRIEVTRRVIKEET